MRYSRHYRRRQVPWLAYVAVASVALLLAYWIGSNISRPRGQTGQSGDLVDTPGTGLAAGPEVATDRITAGTEFVYLTQYASTGRVEQQVSAPPETMLDLTREALSSLYPQWQIEAFSSQQVVFRRVETGIDPATRQEEDSQYRTLAVRDGYIVVLAGRPHPEADVRLDDLRLLKQTDIPVSRLPADEADRLSQGIVVEGDEEVARNLEGYLN